MAQKLYPQTMTLIEMFRLQGNERSTIDFLYVISVSSKRQKRNDLHYLVGVSDDAGDIGDNEGTLVSEAHHSHMRAQRGKLVRSHFRSRSSHRSQKRALSWLGEDDEGE